MAWVQSCRVVFLYALVHTQMSHVGIANLENIKKKTKQVIVWPTFCLLISCSLTMEHVWLSLFIIRAK